MKYLKAFLIGSMIASLAIILDCSKKAPTEPTNNAPNIPSNPSPSNGAAGQSVDVDLSWTGGDPDGDPVTYDVYFGTNSPPSLVSSNQSATSYDPGTLDYSTKYYWKIVAEDNNGAKSEGSVWEFTTIKAGWDETKDASGTYYDINGNYYDPDPDNGYPWISLSSYGTEGAAAAWSFYGLNKADVETLVVGSWSYDDGWDATGGEEYWVYNHTNSTWDYWFTSDKTQGNHGFYKTSSLAREYIRVSDGAVFLELNSGYSDHSHIKQVYCQERGVGQ